MNGVAAISINGQTVRLKFGLPAVRRIFQKMEELPEDFTTGNHYSDIGLSHILFSGYQNACLMEDARPALAYKDFYELVEDARFDAVLQDSIVAAIRIFEESRFVKRMSEPTEEEEKKSPLIGMN